MTQYTTNPKNKKKKAQRDAEWYSNPENKKKEFERRAKPENRKKRAERDAKWYINPENKKRVTERHIETRNGITSVQYQKASDNQGNKCAICGSQTVGDKRKTRFCIDHEHVLGYGEMSSFEKIKYFRGLLCHSCNCILKEGYENFETLQKYIDYIKNPPAKELDLKYTKSKAKILKQNLISKFGDRCQIDLGHNPGFKGVFYIDHNHVTKNVRGLLCHNCNAILGSARDSPEILENAIKYLEAYQKRKQLNEK